MRCPGCGLEADGDAAAACLARYHELSAYTLSDRDPTFPHQLAVDAYAAQHAGATSRPMTIAFALIGLYLVFERGFTGHQAQRAHMFLGRRKQEWPRLAPPDDRGAITVADVVAAGETGRNEAIRRWAASVWAAWHEQHERVAGLVRDRFDRRGGQPGSPGR
jgi:hypothetical protein